MAILDVRHLTKIYEGKISYKALDNINFSIEKGEFVGIMGPSGSGKTTLLNMIATIDKPTSGEIFIGGKNPHSLNKRNTALFRRRELGFVFQYFNLLDTLTVEENIVLPLTLDGVKIKEMEKKLVFVSKKLGIDNILKKRVYEISGGQMQRTAIARAIIHTPSLILADEPTGNLDSKSSKDVMETMSAINIEEGATTMMVTHDAVAASYCDRVIFIKDGKFYNEIYKGENRQAFFQKIIDMLSLLGGDTHDLSTVRL
ncbi:ABC transporter ATP-binding protein [Priestia endophytica]|jgi:putative ABC transport system ATP-binding protein|uniref:Bacitracin ABC transporter ATP-binding protein n=2 Tax=Priestia endophytica TaxID=135735 RepID=A0AAX1Q269_9BACI|nr:ABC transporter ATP-binding protein [Priestia endophytica]KAB2495995.1 ABC transporter ATP-binding protein [Priestia endophytica]KYG31617.1 bacitracin ABC transporter ATP-binding protein [Priestia endophytica]MBG9811522.1 bacitracin ABC transporter ATP-binding protein [Priestia endophytica]MCM3537066.1 ABC transporter ATP-binding protein [Priestia endophytica]RAS71918.1 bacitracin ABC transporter ATP-binding protein [Priestia endophytica]